MVSVVNGYVCFTSCDVAAAKNGRDPKAPPGAPPGTSSKSENASSFDTQPVTILDGALKELASANAVSPTGGVAPSSAGAQPLVNILA